jgi:hypothetical protein
VVTNVPDGGRRSFAIATSDTTLVEIAPAPTWSESPTARSAPTARHEAYARAVPEIVVHARMAPVLFLRWRTSARAATRRARCAGLPVVLRELGREELQAACRSHGLRDSATSRARAFREPALAALGVRSSDVPTHEIARVTLHPSGP